MKLFAPLTPADTLAILKERIDPIIWNDPVWGGQGVIRRSVELRHPTLMFDGTEAQRLSFGCYFNIVSVMGPKDNIVTSMRILHDLTHMSLPEPWLGPLDDVHASLCRSERTASVLSEVMLFHDVPGLRERLNVPVIWYDLLRQSHPGIFVSATWFEELSGLRMAVVSGSASTGDANVDARIRGYDELSEWMLAYLQRNAHLKRLIEDDWALNVMHAYQESHACGVGYREEFPGRPAPCPVSIEDRRATNMKLAERFFVHEPFEWL